MHYVTLKIPIEALCVGAAVVALLGTRRKLRGHSKDDPDDPDDFIAAGSTLLQWIAGYRQRCQTSHVCSRVKPNFLFDALPSSAPPKGEPWSAIVHDLTAGERPSHPPLCQ